MLSPMTSTKEFIGQRHALAERGGEDKGGGLRRSRAVLTSQTVMTASGLSPEHEQGRRALQPDRHDLLLTKKK